MSVQTFYGRQTHSFLWGGLRATGQKITIIRILNRLNYRKIFTYMHYLQIWPPAA